MWVDYSIHHAPVNDHVHFFIITLSIEDQGAWLAKEKTQYKLDENGERIPQIDKRTGKQKIGARGRKCWERETVKLTDWDSKERAEEWRESWARMCNERLPEGDQIDHRSHERRGIEEVPTVHVGYGSDRADREAMNAEAKKINAEIRRLKAEQREVEKRVETQKKIDELTKRVEQIEKGKRTMARIWKYSVPVEMEAERLGKRAEKQHGENIADYLISTLTDCKSDEDDEMIYYMQDRYADWMNKKEEKQMGIIGKITGASDTPPRMVEGQKWDTRKHKEKYEYNDDEEEEEETLMDDYVYRAPAVEDTNIFGETEEEEKERKEKEEQEKEQRQHDSGRGDNYADRLAAVMMTANGIEHRHADALQNAKANFCKADTDAPTILEAYKTIQRAAENGDKEAAQFLEQHEDRLPPKFAEDSGRMTDKQKINNSARHRDAQNAEAPNAERAAAKANTKNNTRSRNDGGRGAR